MSENGYRIAVVGATGAVGTVMLQKLSDADLPIAEIVPFASERSAGKDLPGVGKVQALTDESIAGFDIALFSAGGKISAEWAPKFVESGAVVIDNSSQWRRDPNVPLVVSEVNPEALDDHRGIIANPNCSTMQLVVALKPIFDEVGIERLVVSTYQSTSGTGLKAIEELHEQTRAALSPNVDDMPEPQVYPHPIAFNVIGAAGNFVDGDDYTDEERKMMFETRKILGSEDILLSVTCVRVPVTISHSESVNVQTRTFLSADDCRELLRNAPGIEVVDDPSTHSYPTPLQAAGQDDVFVGRIRQDGSHKRALNMWVVSDNLLKGAATNAVQLAELIHARDLVRVQV